MATTDRTKRNGGHERASATPRARRAAPHAEQSAAAPSPFPPIADYAFLSNCHTGALVAPDGSVDWLCVPAFDSPSVFGNLLDRQAGYFRFGPFGINHPTARAYEPGTNVLVTTWQTPRRLDRGARRADDGAARAARTRSPRTPGRRPTTTPTTCWCARSSASRGRSRSSWSASRRSTTAATPAEWTLVDGGRHTADATGGGPDDPAADRPARSASRATASGPGTC